MNEPEAKPDAEYTTQQAADRCGMSINTLLAWERRYGVPSPRRNARDERIYTDADLRVIQWLKDETARGTSIGQAVRRLPLQNDPPAIPDTASDDVVVALDPARAAEPDRHASVAVDHDHSQTAIWQQALVAALHEHDRSKVATILGNAALASSPLQATEQVIVPTMQRVVAMAEAGEIDRVVADTGERWFSAHLSHWLDISMLVRDLAETNVVVLPSAAPWSLVWMLAIALRRAKAGDAIIDLSPDCPIETIQSVVKQVGATEVVLLAHDAAECRVLHSRLNLLRSILPATVELTLLEPDPRLSPDDQSHHDTRQSTSRQVDFDIPWIIHKDPNASPYPDS